MAQQISALIPPENANPSALGLLPGELAEILAEMGEPGYRAAQLFQALHRRQVSDWAEMTDLPIRVRATLARQLTIGTSTLVSQAVSNDRTRKRLLRLHDGQEIETVAIPALSAASRTRRVSVCVSTQAGCAMACSFCATGMMGLARNLSAAEIVDQVYGFGREVEPLERPTHVVFMGMGEPMANYAATVRAVRLLCHREGANLSQRRITVSTSGLVPQINRLAEEGLEITLAISLHAPNDELRSSLVPVNRRWPIAELLEAGDRYAQRTHRRVSYEYVLLGGVNDSASHADELGRTLRGRLAHVNLIPYNPTDANYRRTPPGQARSFRDRLAAAGIAATIRASRGQDIAAACGQLITK